MRFPVILFACSAIFGTACASERPSLEAGAGAAGLLGGAAQVDDGGRAGTTGGGGASGRVGLGGAGAIGGVSGASGGVSGASGGVSGASGGVSGASSGVSGASSGVSGASSGAPGASGGGSSGDGTTPAGYVPGIVAVGYGGLRVVSRDRGRTWRDAVAFGEANEDDENLLRAVVYGGGRWIATGWKLVYSEDGVQWTEHSMVEDVIEDQRIIEGLAYANGYFYAAGDPGKLYRSADGLAWERYGGAIGNTEKHTTLAYRGGTFVAYGDSRTSFESVDGTRWTAMTLEDATFCEGQWRTREQCHDAAWFDGGFYLHAEWGGEIRRSTDGARFETVYSDPDEHTPYRSFTFADGYVKP